MQIDIILCLSAILYVITHIFETQICDSFDDIFGYHQFPVLNTP